MTDIIAMLDSLADLRAAPDAIRLQKDALIDTILTPEIRAQLAEIEAEFAPKLQAAQDAAEMLETAIKAEVIANGATVKGAHMMAVWNKGRVSWDGTKLDGMMSLIPQLKDARKEGAPSITIRKV